MSDDPLFQDPLVRCLDAAAEQIRAANHHTYSPREVTDLYPALGALHALFSRFDQLADYLLRTVRARRRGRLPPRRGQTTSPSC